MNNEQKRFIMTELDILNNVIHNFEKDIPITWTGKLFQKSINRKAIIKNILSKFKPLNRTHFHK